jgi:ubiquinone/menaquinone biosynthesis C-methylase UbiE
MLAILLFGSFLLETTARAARPKQTDAKPPEGGLLVHVGCGTGSQTVRLARGGKFVVHGLEKDVDKVAKARRLVRSNGLYGHVSVEQWTSSRLPYADSLVDLLVTASTGAPSEKEIMRVLRPGGVAKVGSKTISKPWPADAGRKVEHVAEENVSTRPTRCSGLLATRQIG